MSRQIGEMPTKSFKPGEFIFREGDDAKGEAFMVQDGKVEIRRHFGDEDRVLRVLGKGDLLGDLALFRSAPRSANAVAAEPVTLLLIPANRLEHLVRSNPALAIAIIKQLATRMLEAEDRARAAEERLRAAEERARAAEERARAAEDRLKGSA